MQNVNQKFAVENVRLWLNRAKSFGVTESELTALVRTAYTKMHDEQRPATPAEVAKSFEQ
jgi:hypothetical protein